MSLRARVARGGTYLAARQGIGMLIHVVGVLLLTRAIGPAAYGLYAAALGIYTYLFELSQWGIGVYLIRREGDTPPEVYDQAFTALLLLAAGGWLLAVVALPLVEGWIDLDGFRPLFLAMTLALPVMLQNLVPLARLERELEYRRVAFIEVGGLVAFYAVALPLAYAGSGAWAPVAGWGVQQVGQAIALHAVAGRRPRLRWDGAALREMTSYGLGYSASLWVWQLRYLVNPLLVGRYLGADAVGFVALAIQLVRNLGFVMVAIWRLSTSALARVQEAPERLARAITEGMELQILAVAPPLLAFAWVAPWAVPLLFGPDWSPMAVVFPFVAFGYLAMAMFNLHSSALYVRKHNWEVALFHTVHVLLFASVAAWLIPTLGIVGYGWAEVATVASYSVVHGFLAARIASPQYRTALVWWAAAGLALFATEAWWPALTLVVAALWPGTWHALSGHLRTLRLIRNG